MAHKLLYALAASSIAVGASMTTSALVLTWTPKGKPREVAERYLIAPGELVFERLHKRKGVKKLLKAGEAGVEAGREKLEKLPHLYNIGAWAASGFALCLIMTLLLGISSFKDALALGIKVTITLAFLQAGLILAGLLALHRLSGS